MIKKRAWIGQVINNKREINLRISYNIKISLSGQSII